MIWAFLLLNLIDYLQTKILLSQGATEGNPVWSILPLEMKLLFPFFIFSVIKSQRIIKLVVIGLGVIVIWNFVWFIVGNTCSS